MILISLVCLCFFLARNIKNKKGRNRPIAKNYNDDEKNDENLESTISCENKSLTENKLLSASQEIVISNDDHQDLTQKYINESINNDDIQNFGQGGDQIKHDVIQDKVLEER